MNFTFMQQGLGEGKNATVNDNVAGCSSKNDEVFIVDKVCEDLVNEVEKVYKESGVRKSVSSHFSELDVSSFQVVTYKPDLVNFFRGQN